MQSKGNTNPISKGFCKFTLHNGLLCIRRDYFTIIGECLPSFFRQWVIREWERKKTQHAYTTPSRRSIALKERSNLKPAYFIRYADDWVLQRSLMVDWYDNCTLGCHSRAEYKIQRLI